MPLILETIVTTLSPTGALHLVPFGLIREDAAPEAEAFMLAPFRPSPVSRRLGDTTASGSDCHQHDSASASNVHQQAPALLQPQTWSQRARRTLLAARRPDTHVESES